MDLEVAIKKLPTTHTFGGSKTWDKNTLYPFKQILIYDRSILSQRLREEKNDFIKGEPKRTMTKAKDLGLDAYVFGYLGNHEHFYSSTNGSIAPPFGVFFPSQLDNRKNTNATRYDVQSPYCRQFEGREIYQSIDEARPDAHTRVLDSFAANLFSYWVCPDYDAKDYYDKNSWKWKVEFHYHEKVDLEEIKAVLWPVVYELELDTATKSVIYIANDKYEFWRNQFENDPRNKGIIVYPFPWVAKYSIQRFSYASFLISHYIAHFGSYPSVLDFQELFIKKFSSIV